MGKPKNSLDQLGRRERQIMEIVHRLGEASVAQVREALPDPPSYSSVRTMIRHLETKGYVRHRQENAKYIYRPTQSTNRASKSALKSLLSNFFHGSTSDAIAALLEVSDRGLSESELKRLEDIVQQEKQRRAGQ